MDLVEVVVYFFAVAIPLALIGVSVVGLNQGFEYNEQIDSFCPDNFSDNSVRYCVLESGGLREFVCSFDNKECYWVGATYILKEGE